MAEQRLQRLMDDLDRFRPGSLSEINPDEVRQVIQKVLKRDITKTQVEVARFGSSI